MKAACCPMSDFQRTPEGLNVLHLTTEGYAFKVYAHPGKDATRTRRLVQKLMAPKMAAQAGMLETVRNRMTAAERDRASELQEMLQSLDGTAKGSEIEKELQGLFDKYQDQSDSLAAYADMMADLDIDQEEILDALAFKHTSVKCLATDNQMRKLSDAVTFDAVFMGPASELVDSLRQEIFQFNGFLGKGQNGPKDAEAPKA